MGEGNPTNTTAANTTTTTTTVAAASATSITITISIGTASATATMGDGSHDGNQHAAVHGSGACGAYGAAAAHLAEMQSTPLPARKVECICAAVRAVSTRDASTTPAPTATPTPTPTPAPTLNQVSTRDASADQLLPSLIYALLLSPVRAPHAECKFVLEFLHEDTDLHGATGYALATFQAAVEGCTQLEPEPEQRKNGPPQGVL